MVGSGSAFLESVADFQEFGKQTQCFTEQDIPYMVNEYWTAQQRQGHSIHEVSYRACFKPQLPEFFISRLTQPNDAVYDPFMGRGTTLIEAALMDRQPMGNDINPLSSLLVRPRLQPPAVQDVADRLKQVDWARGEIERDDLLAFYHPDTLKQIGALKQWLLDRAPIDQTHPDPVDDWIRMVAINRLTGHSGGFFSGRTLPPNQAVSVKAQQRINAKLGQQPPLRDVAALIVRKSKRLLTRGTPAARTDFVLSTSSATGAPKIPTGSASLVVTSPPFLDIVQYADDNWLRCWFAGIDVSNVAIAMHKTPEAWTQMVHEVLTDLARIVKPGGFVAFEVGEVRKGKVLLERLVWKAAEGLPFDRLAVVVNQQEFTKTANCWGVSNNSSGTNTNRIVVLQRQS